MAITLKLTDRVNSLTLEDGSGGTHRITYNNLQFGVADTQGDFHIGADRLPRLIQVTDDDLFCQFNMNVFGSRATVDQALTTLRRWVKGKDQQAARAELNPSVRPVYLAVKLDGSANETWFRVRLGNIDEDRSLISQFTTNPGTTSPGALNVLIQLRLYPWGETENWYEVDNAIPGSPHMMEYDESTGLAHGITKQGTPTTSIVFDKALIGGSAMKVTTSSINDGINTDYGTVPAYHLAIALVWLIVDDGSVRVRIQGTGATTLETQEDITASWLTSNAETTATDRNGNTWYLVKLTQATESTVSTMRIKVTADDVAGSTFWVDGISLQTVEAINLFSNPGMELDADGDGNVDGWVPGVDFPGTSGSSTFDVVQNGTHYAKGASSALWTTTSESAIGTYLMDADTSGVTYTCRFLMEVNTGVSDATVTFYLSDGAGNTLDSISVDTTSVTGQDSTLTGDDSHTWYIFTLTGTNSLAPGVRFWMQDEADATSVSIYIDELYVYRGTGPEFNRVQVFRSQIRNRFDPTSTNEQYVNVLDFYNVPGDLDAALRLRLRFGQGQSTTGMNFWISRYIEESYRPLTHSYECESTDGHFTVGDSGSGTWSDDSSSGASAYSSGEARRFTAGAPLDGGYIEMGISPDDALSWASTPRRIFVRARADAINDTIQFKYVSNNGQTTKANDIIATFTTADTFEWLDLGPLDIYYSPAADNYQGLVGDVLQLHVTIASNTNTIDIDKIEFLPVGPGNFGFWSVPKIATYDTLIVDGDRREVVRASDGVVSYSVPGGVWEVGHGLRLTRLVIGWSATDDDHDIGDYADVTAKIKPRTRLLLSTI